MFRYTSSISDLSHNIIDNFVINKNVAIDATLGNGYDTDFLSLKFNKVFSFEIQKISCDSYKEKSRDNVKIINDSHHLFDNYIKEEVDCIMYNLGFLPGGNKEITTKHETTLKSINDGLKLLKSGGIMTICIYKGHTEGKREESCIIDFVKSLPKNTYGVMCHSYINRTETAPLLLVIEKK